MTGPPVPDLRREGWGRSPAPALLLGGVLLVVAACEGGEARPESNARMAARLDSFVRADDPRTNPQLNTERVRLLRQRELPPNRRVRMINRAMVGQELLKAGKTEEAIRAFRGVLDTMPTLAVQVPRQFRLKMHDLLALAHLRSWQQANCIRRADIGSCLLPMRPGREPAAVEHARAAVRGYRRLLELKPDDRDMVWLLNLAHMAVGDYPEGVPERWRIAPANLRGEGRVPRFPDVAPDHGLDVLGHAGGSVVADFDGDGELDLVTSGRGPGDQLRYFRSRGDGTFVDATKEAGLEGLVKGLQIVPADYDNDGQLDVLVLRGAWTRRGYPNSLLRNDGDGTFTDVTLQAGLGEVAPTQTAGWADYDLDGDLDLFVGNETRYPEKGPVHPAALYRNEGDGTFTDVAPDVGLDVVGFIKGVAWGDYDNDGRPDLYLSLLYEGNHLFRNAGPEGEGGWSFTDVTEQAGVGTPEASYPTWFFDYDNDGWLDLFVSGFRANLGDIVAEYRGEEHGAVPPRLYRNQGDGTFRDVTERAGLDRVMYTMGSNFGDLDNDGWQDFYVGTGYPDLRMLIPNRMFVNRPADAVPGSGSRVFREVTISGGFGHLGKGHGVSFADIDGDGDQDVYAVFGAAYEGDVYRNALFENPGFGHHWVTLRLVGRETNRAALGARVEIRVVEGGERRTIHRRVSAGGSFGGNSLQLEIGLGEADRIVALEVYWPVSDTRVTYRDVEMDHVYRVEEGAEALEPVHVSSFDLSG